MARLVQFSVIFSTFSDGTFNTCRSVCINPWRVSSVEWHQKKAKLVAIRMKNGDVFVVQVGSENINHVLKKLELLGKRADEPPVAAVNLGDNL